MGVLNRPAMIAAAIGAAGAIAGRGDHPLTGRD
jgi:hypothetical protein